MVTGRLQHRKCCQEATLSVLKLFYALRWLGYELQLWQVVEQMDGIRMAGSAVLCQARRWGWKRVEGRPRGPDMAISMPFPCLFDRNSRRRAPFKVHVMRRAGGVPAHHGHTAPAGDRVDP